MFYAHFILAKKGPLARIWLAAHWDKKLTKAHVFETNIETSVDGIMQPKVKMALRTSGHLLLGVVRIYSRKAKYLLADCNEAFVKIKMAFRPGMVDLPEEHREAAVNAITLPEVFHDFDTTMPELNDVDIEAQFSLNQSRAEEITMREDYGNVPVAATDDGFGDMGFDSDAPEIVRQATAGTANGVAQNGVEAAAAAAAMLFADGGAALDGTVATAAAAADDAGTSRGVVPMDIEPARTDEGFAGGLFEGGLFDDTPSTVAHTLQEVPLARPPHADDSDDDMDHFGGPMSVGGASSDDGSRPSSAIGSAPTTVPPAVAATSPPQRTNGITAVGHLPPAEEDIGEDAVVASSQVPPTDGADQTTLLQNEEESFALAPVDASALKGLQKAKRKRKLIVDEVKNISGEEMKNQLSDTSDIVTTLDLAPPTKRLMHWKETGGVEKLFTLPARPLPAGKLFQNYQRHLLQKTSGTEDFAMLGDADSLALEHVREADESHALEAALVPPPAALLPPSTPRRGRKRKLPPTDESTPAVARTPAHLSEPDESFASLMGAPLPSPQVMQPPPTPSMYPQQQLPPNYQSSTPLPEEIPHLPPEQVSSILQESSMGQLPAMENMGYDQSQMANMGYDEQQAGPSPAGAMSERIQSPWQGDFDFPPSMGPPDEQLQDETVEQFEERVLNKRAFHMFNTVKSKLSISDDITFTELCHRNPKKLIAQKFYSLLVLKKFQALQLEQSDSYGEIYVKRGARFDNPEL